MDMVTWTGDVSHVDARDWCGTLRNNIPLQSVGLYKRVEEDSLVGFLYGEIVCFIWPLLVVVDE